VHVCAARLSRAARSRARERIASSRRLHSRRVVPSADVPDPTADVVLPAVVAVWNFSAACRVAAPRTASAQHAVYDELPPHAA
jgi:hypothetical protein